MNYKKQVPIEKSPLQILVTEDFKKFEKLVGPVMEQINKSVKRRAYTESLLLSWAFVEQIMLPSLIRQVAHRLSFKNVPKIDERVQAYQLISFYLFLTHDSQLYTKLLYANKLRREIVHGLQTSDDVYNLNKRARKATKYIVDEILGLFMDRLSGKVAVPVLALYSNGWNDCREETLKRLNELKQSVGQFRRE
ncbi:MAG: hypothetical protein K8Q97_00365 [Candidatus Andersenbacteria bacterium]|nr:hypothetical protein [Candidatus Andersenbacteria bacterium]